MRAVANRFRADGLRVWFDEWKIKPRTTKAVREKKIEKGLEHSRVLVLCMSANAFGSDWAQLEAGTLQFCDPLNKERRFVPLHLDESPIKGSLAQFLYINWLPDDREQEYAKLLEACHPAARQPEEEEPVIPGIQENRDVILSRFFPALSAHSRETTDVVDYFQYLEAKETWGHGSGTFLTTTQNEIVSLWGDIGLCGVYEAFLLRFKNQGGEVSRIFVMGREIFDRIAQHTFSQIILRHHLLGFETRFVSVLDTNNSSQMLGFDCDVLAVLNQVIAYFIRLRSGEYPVLVKTEDKATINKAVKAYRYLHNISRPSQEWLRDHSFKLTANEKRKIEQDYHYICEIAKLPD